MNKQRKKKKSKNTIGKIGWVLFLVGLGIGGWKGWDYYQRIYAPSVLSENPGFLFIPSGADQADVIDLLVKGQFVKNKDAFAWLADQKNYKEKNIVPGKYKIRKGWNNNELINHLRAGNGVLEVTVQFGQLRSKQQLAGHLAANIEADSAEVHHWLTHPDSIGRYGFNHETIWALFIPNTYRVSWATSASQLMQRMAEEFKKFWTTERKARAKALGMSQSEVVTLASIVYWETKKPEDMPRVAGVYINRLKIGMPLQADPTLIFALGDFTIRRVLDKHKRVDSPYNTYKHRGLPPGPIIIPPVAFIDAVLNYEKHEYYYFCAKEDLSGYSNFAKTYRQHLVYARRYQKAMNKRGIYR